MSRRLDEQLSDLKANAEAHPRLGALEANVWRRIEGRVEARGGSGLLLAVRASALVAALGVGLASGGFAAAEAVKKPSEISAFSIRTGVAPSTLLDDRV